MKLDPAIAAVLVAACMSCSSVGAPPVSGEDGASDSFVITADEVEAEEGPRGRVAKLSGHVTIARRGATLSGLNGAYYEDEGRAVVFGDVAGVDGSRRVACDTLVYFRDEDVADLRGHASYSDSSGTTSAHRITLLRREGVAVCRGGVVASDADGTSDLLCERLAYDFDSGLGRASRGPRLVTYEDGRPTATLSADVIEFSASGQEVRAFGEVVIERDDISARSRTAALSEDGIIVLTGDPVVERGEDRLSGDRVIVSVRDGEVSRVISTGNALASYTVEGGEGENAAQEPARGTVSGDTLTMFMDGGEPVLTTVRGRAASVHEVGSAGERNSVTSRAIDIQFDSGRIERVTFRGNASGVYEFPPEEPRGEAPGLPAGGRAALPSGGPAGQQSDAVAGAAASDSLAMERVSYGSDEIRYYVARNRIMLSGRARVEYRTTELFADDIVFDPDAQTLEASGNPDLREKSDRLVGARLSYDLESSTGAIEGGVTTYEDGLYYGGRIVREADGTLAVRRGTYTTCSDPEPHYCLVSHRMKIYIDDKVVAKPVILYIGKIPVLALPFYVFPIKTGRHSGFLLPQVELGLTEGEGRFIRNFGYYWAPNDYFDASLWADYYEQTKWIGHVESRYKLRYVFSGSVKASFMQELLFNKRRWDLKFNHRHEFGRVWTAGTTGTFRSDATYASDSNQDIQESSNRSLHSQVWARGRWSSRTLGVTFDRREQIDEGSVSELLPKVELTASQQPAVDSKAELPSYLEWLKDVSYGWSARAVNDRDRNGGETVVHQGVGVKANLRGTGKLLGWLSLSPRLSLEQDWYDRDRDGRKLPGRFTYEAGVSARTTVYGTFFPELLGLQAVRHIIEPSASFTWTPEFPRYLRDDGSDRFYSFSGFGATPRARRSVSLSLVNKLQLKLGSGDDVTKLDNFLRVSTSTSYNFKETERPWSDLVTGVEVRPGSAMSLRWNARHSAYGGAIESSSLTATVDLRGEPPLVSADPWEDRVASTGSPAEQLREELAARTLDSLPGRRPWDASLTFRYSRGADPANASYWVDARVAMSPSAKWRVNYSLHYDIREGEVASQEYTIYRDLHCWEAHFTRRYYEGEWGYYFRINVKALPEIQAEAGRKHLDRPVR